MKTQDAVKDHDGFPDEPRPLAVEKDKSKQQYHESFHEVNTNRHRENSAIIQDSSTLQKLPLTPELHSASVKITSADILGGIKRATGLFKLCPNRVWSVTRNLPGGIRNIHFLFPPNQDCQLLPPEPVGLMDHRRCTFDLCEHSQCNFTSVEQRHECYSNKMFNCGPMKGHFPSNILNDAVEKGELTAWKFSGRSLVAFPRQYMAISHVWSDGTGTGAWPDKGVNRCLWVFFRDIAKIFQVQGIWWDTISIPRSPKARSQAIKRMHTNYEDARVTLVHDCFLRQVSWDASNPKASAANASLAIVMSPWFSRGWTALELAKSRKVAILLGKDSGYVLKDLDEDILAHAEDSRNTTEAHKVATRAIVNLRRVNITEMNDLLTVLGPRHTSWTRDTAIIAGLLVDIEIVPEDSQQLIYQKILWKFGQLYHGHLFHNAARMSKAFNWCPANPLSMSLASSRTILQIEEDGSITGKWKALSVQNVPKNLFVWIGIHPVTEVELRAAIEEPMKHVFLVEPEVEDILRALLVRVTGQSPSLGVCGQVIGFLPFHEPLNLQDEDFVEVQVNLGDVKGLENNYKGAWCLVKSLARENTWDRRHQICIDSDLRREEDDIVKHCSSHEMRADEDTEDSLSLEGKSCELVLAAESGQAEQVKQLLRKKANPNFQDRYKWTALHRAVWRGHREVVKELINQKADPTIQDGLGQSPLTLSADRGVASIFSLLIPLGFDLNVKYKSGFNGQTLLHFAAWGGSTAIMHFVREYSELDSRDHEGRTALHIASEKSDLPVLGLLLDWGAGIDIRDNRGWTALSYAARHGHKHVVSLLLNSRNINVNVADNFGRTPLFLAAWHGHKEVVKLLLGQANVEPNVVDKFGRTPLFRATLHGHIAVAQVLSKYSCEHFQNHPLNLSESCMTNSKDAVIDLLLEHNDFQEWKTRSDHNEHPLQWATEHGFCEIAEFLLEHGEQADPRDIMMHQRHPLSLAASHSDLEVCKMFLMSGDVDINYCQLPYGLTHLTSAALLGQMALVNLMIETGEVDFNLEDGTGTTALANAATQGHEAIVKRLLETGQADVDHKCVAGYTALIGAAKFGHATIVKQLLDTGQITDIDHLDWERRTALSYAAERGHEAAIRELFAGGQKPDIYREDRYRRTPLSYAAQSGLDTVIADLYEKGQKVIVCQ